MAEDMDDAIVAADGRFVSVIAAWNTDDGVATDTVVLFILLTTGVETESFGGMIGPVRLVDCALHITCTGTPKDMTSYGTLELFKRDSLEASFSHISNNENIPQFQMHSSLLKSQSYTAIPQGSLAADKDAPLCCL